MSIAKCAGTSEEESSTDRAEFGQLFFQKLLLLLRRELGFGRSWRCRSGCHANHERLVYVRILAVVCVIAGRKVHMPLGQLHKRCQNCMCRNLPPSHVIADSRLELPVSHKACGYTKWNEIQTEAHKNKAVANTLDHLLGSDIWKSHVLQLFHELLIDLFCHSFLGSFLELTCKSTRMSWVAGLSLSGLPTTYLHSLGSTPIDIASAFFVSSSISSMLTSPPASAAPAAPCAGTEPYEMPACSFVLSTNVSWPGFRLVCISFSVSVRQGFPHVAQTSCRICHVKRR